MRLVLYQPEIPHNVGALLRLSACWQVALECIGPFPFLWSDRHLKRAGMDYVSLAHCTRHSSWEAYWTPETQAYRHIVLTPKGERSFIDFSFAEGDRLILGSESTGVPDAVMEEVGERLFIPMSPWTRSLNMSMSAAIVLTEALRQTRAFPKGLAMSVATPATATVMTTPGAADTSPTSI